MASGVALDPGVVASNANFIVGLQIPFSLSGLPADATATKFQWSFQGHYVNTRTNEVPGMNFPDCSRSYYADAKLLTNPTVTNWWVSGAFIPVPYKASVSCDLIFTNGNPSQKCNASGLLGMARPRAKISPVTSSVSVWTNNGVPALQFLHATSSSTNEGITFYYSLEIPPGFSGTAFWIQTISDASRTAMENNSTVHNSVYPPFPNLDSVAGELPFPYQSFIGTNAADSPGQPLSIFSTNYVSVAGSGTFNMWLMFAPDGGVGVPLRVVNWSWSGSATNNGSGWSLLQGTNSVNPSDADTETNPRWINNSTNPTGWNPHL
jgi:hypothetical protein